ncbi:MAG: hypothetical protein ACI83P_000487 [Janthinobacterium sp.]
MELQQRFATGKNDVFAGRVGCWPQAVDDASECCAAGKLVTALTIGTDEIGITKAADGGGAIAFAPVPQIASGKTAKNGRATGMCALTLQCIENFFNAVSHSVSQCYRDAGRRNGADPGLRIDKIHWQPAIISCVAWFNQKAYFFNGFHAPLFAPDSVSIEGIGDDCNYGWRQACR